MMDWAPSSRFRFLDLLIVCAVLALAGWAWPMLTAGPGREATVFIEGKPEVRLQLSGEERELVVKGRLGPMRLVYGKSGVRVGSVGCPNQICVHQGWVRRAGARLTCLPSHVVIALDRLTAVEEGPDGVTY